MDLSTSVHTDKIHSMLTLSEAATAVGLSKSAIHKAIKRGQLSANRTDSGEWRVDPAELFRVYPPVDQVVDQRPPVHETEMLRLRLEERERQIRMLEDERNYLRSKLDQSDEERRRLSMLLVDQSAPKSTDTVPPPPSERPSLVEKLFGRRRG